MVECVCVYLRSSSLWNPTAVASITHPSVCGDRIPLHEQVGIELRKSSCHNAHDVGVTGVCHSSWLWFGSERWVILGMLPPLRAVVFCLFAPRHSAGTEPPQGRMFIPVVSCQALWNPPCSQTCSLAASWFLSSEPFCVQDRSIMQQKARLIFCDV